MSIKLHTGSIPFSHIDHIGAEMLVVLDGCMDCSGHECIQRILCSICNKEMSQPFADTTTGQHLYNARDTGFPAGKYGVVTGSAQLFGESGAVAVDGIMRSVAGMGVKTLVVFTVSPINFHCGEGEILLHIVEWLCSHKSELTDLYFLSNAVGNSAELRGAILLKEHPKYGGVIVDAGQLCQVCDGEGGWWYYADCGVGMVKIFRVVRNPDSSHVLAKLTVPTELNGKRVVAIDDNAFVQTEADLLSVGEEVEDWTKILEELYIPRFVSQMNPERIIDSLPALEHVTVDPRNHHFEEDERMLIRRLR